MRRNIVGQAPNYVKDSIKLPTADDWRTPKPIFDLLNAEFKFELDACADKDNALCERFYTLDNSALDPYNHWNVNTFCNYPYSSPSKFFEKAWWEAQTWDKTIVLFAKVATSENYWSRNVRDAHVRFLKGRVKFWDINNTSHYGATFSSAIIIFSPETFDNPKTEYWDYRGEFPQRLF